MPGAPTDRRSSPLPFILFMVLLCALFLFLSGLYGRRFPLMAPQFDVWFRTDVNHYMRWIKELAFAYRFPLHPGTLLLLKPYSLLCGRFLPFDARFLPGFALPVVLFTTTTLLTALTRLDSRYLLLFAPVALVVSPLLLLAPIPESHTLGGVSLLMVVTAVWRSLSEGETDQRRWLKQALWWGLAATGFSVSNIVPAFLVLFPLWHGFRPTRKQIIATLGGVGGIALLGLLQFAVKYRQEGVQENFLLFVGARFARWLPFPDAVAVGRALRALLMAPFGVPDTAPFGYTSEAGVQYSGVILRDGPNWLQIAAACCWFIGIALWLASLRRKEGTAPTISFVIGCGLALLWLCLFHSFFAADEAFMFSVHAWPFFLTPGLLALRDGIRSRSWLPCLFLGLAIALALLQTVVALPVLFRLPV